VTAASSLSGGIAPASPDLAAALALVPLVRADLDKLELSLLLMARGRGMTWSEIAFGLGLRSAQAAPQRHDWVASRAEAQ